MLGEQSVYFPEVIKKLLIITFLNRIHLIMMINIKPILFLKEIQMYHLRNMLNIKTTQKNHPNIH